MCVPKWTDHEQLISLQNVLKYNCYSLYFFIILLESIHNTPVNIQNNVESIRHYVVYPMGTPLVILPFDYTRPALFVYNIFLENNSTLVIYSIQIQGQAKPSNTRTILTSFLIYTFSTNNALHKNLPIPTETATYVMKNCTLKPIQTKLH